MEDNTLVQEYLWTCSYLNEHGQWRNCIFYAANEADAMHTTEKLQRATGKAIMAVQVTHHPQGLVCSKIVYPGIIRYMRKSSSDANRH